MSVTDWILAIALIVAFIFIVEYGIFEYKYYKWVKSLDMDDGEN